MGKNKIETQILIFIHIYCYLFDKQDQNKRGKIVAHIFGTSIGTIWRLPGCILNQLKIIWNTIKCLTRYFLTHPSTAPGHWDFWGRLAGKKIQKNFFFQSCSKLPKTSRKQKKNFEKFSLVPPGGTRWIGQKILSFKFYCIS